MEKLFEVMPKFEGLVFYLRATSYLRNQLAIMAKMMIHFVNLFANFQIASALRYGSASERRNLVILVRFERTRGTVSIVALKAVEAPPVD